jgi:hypothetical protein
MWLVVWAVSAPAQPVVFDVSTNHGGDTIYLGNPAEIVLWIDAGAHDVQGVLFCYAFGFTNGLSVGDMVTGDNLNFSPYAQATFLQLFATPQWMPSEPRDTVFLCGVSFGAPWTGNHEFARIRFEPADTGTVFLDSLHLPPANHTSAIGPTGNDLPLDWRPGPIVVVPCPYMVGDLNGSNTITLADIILLVNYVFKSGLAPQPHVKMGDADCSGPVTSADIIYLVNYQGKGGPAPCPCFIP